MPETFPQTVKYGVLSAHHPDHDRDLLDQIEDLYVGGFRILKKSNKYLRQLHNESSPAYQERCAVTSYQPFFGQIVDQFTSDVFGQPLSIKPAADASDPNTPGDMPDEDFYAEFEKDADRRGTSFVDLMLESLRTALKKRWALVAIDAPAPGSDDPEPATKADEDAQGLGRLYAYCVPVEEMIDWKVDDRGTFVWAVLHTKDQDRDNPFSARNDIKETFTVWVLGGEYAEWARYVVTYDPAKPPKKEDPIALEGRGKSSFKRIPLIRLELPEGLWVGNKVGPQAKEHFQRRSGLISAENRSLFAVPWIGKATEVGAVGGALPSEAQQNPNRGNNPVRQFKDNGWFEIGADDTLGFLEPEGKCYEIIDKQLEGLREAMFQVNFQMAASIKPTGAALGRSGLSKQKDADITERVLRALGHVVREFSVKIYDTISNGRGEDVHWAAHGLDSYAQEDRETLLEEAVALEQIREQIPSLTFHKLMTRMVAEKLVKGADPSTLATIIKELEDGVEDMFDTHALIQDAQTDAILNPQPPMAPKPGQPKVPAAKPPQAKAPAVGART